NKLLPSRNTGSRIRQLHPILTKPHRLPASSSRTRPTRRKRRLSTTINTTPATGSTILTTVLTNTVITDTRTSPITTRPSISRQKNAKDKQAGYKVLFGTLNM
ncbi:MAG TPA: hypothetical protein VFT58_03085, partial [Nitrososphaera sp.]|nr:hypothetical protein [Nitrososphaera sp.]